MGGITTTSTYMDGQMYSMLNLRAKNGALQPVMPAGITGVLPLTPEEQEKIAYLFEHHNEDYRHYIIVFKDNDQAGVGNIRWIDRTHFEAGQSAAAGMTHIYNKADVAHNSLQAIAGNINSIEQNGNMLVFVGDTRQYYALWRGENYTWYGEMPDLPAIQFTCIEEHELDVEDKDEVYSFDGTVAKGAVSFMEATGSKTNLLIKDDLKTMTERMITLLRARLTEQYAGTQYEENKGGFGGLFFDAFMVRYAFRLYDNSTVKLSPPILVMSGSNLYDSILIAVRGYNIFTTEESKILPISSPIVGLSNNTVLINVRNEIGKKVYEYLSIIDEEFSPANTYMKIKGFIPGIKYDLFGFEDYEGLIESVDVFMSPSLNIMTVENAKVEEAAAESIKARYPMPTDEYYTDHPYSD